MEDVVLNGDKGLSMTAQKLCNYLLMAIVLSMAITKKLISKKNMFSL